MGLPFVGKKPEEQAAVNDNELSMAQREAAQATADYQSQALFQGLPSPNVAYVKERTNPPIAINKVLHPTANFSNLPSIDEVRLFEDWMSLAKFFYDHGYNKLGDNAMLCGYTRLSGFRSLDGFETIQMHRQELVMARKLNESNQAKQGGRF